MSHSCPITILIVEDLQIVRLGLSMSLQQFPDLCVVAVADNGKEAVAAAKEHAPNVILMDIGIPEIDGIEAARQIKAILPDVRILMITSHEDEADIYAAFGAGADGYCLKNCNQQNLAVAIRSVHQGAVWLDPGIARKVFPPGTTIGGPESAFGLQDPFGLSARELEVVALLVEGLTNQEMARRLIVSPETVKTHMRHIMDKLAVSDRTQAAVKAVEHGLAAPRQQAAGGAVSTASPSL